MVGLTLAFPCVRSLSPRAGTCEVLHTNGQEKAKACCGKLSGFLVLISGIQPVAAEMILPYSSSLIP